MQTLYTWDSSSPCRRKQGLRGVPFAFGSLQSLPTPSSSSPRDNSLSSGPSRSACRGWPAPTQAFFLLWRACRSVAKQRGGFMGSVPPVKKVGGPAASSSESCRAKRAGVSGDSVPCEKAGFLGSRRLSSIKKGPCRIGRGLA